MDGNAWSAPSAATSVTLPALANGAHTFYVKAIDGAGNDSDPPDERSFTVDTVKPTGSVVINNNRALTTSLSVTLTLRAGDAGGSGMSSMRIANSLSALSKAGWQPYALSKRWRLLGGGSGTRTVYAQYRDRAGNLSVVVLDRIKFRR